MSRFGKDYVRLTPEERRVQQRKCQTAYRKRNYSVRDQTFERVKRKTHYTAGQLQRLRGDAFVNAINQEGFTLMPSNLRGWE